jgi:hypothetical protein
MASMSLAAGFDAWIAPPCKRRGVALAGGTNTEVASSGPTLKDGMPKASPLAGQGRTVRRAHRTDAGKVRATLQTSLFQSPACRGFR